jgi:putative Ca2+/H+ antiporter (TMEM165/GDT1 family)
MADRASELGGKLLALVILLAAAYVLFKLVIGVVAAVAWAAVALIAVVAGLWALNRIL